MAGNFNFAFPHGYDPHMIREEALTLARTTSQQNALQKANTSQSGVQKVDSSTSSGNSPQPKMSNTNGAQTAKPPATTPKRRHFVFADPVAFRHVSLTYLHSLANLP
jgi:hypothetical protein